MEIILIGMMACGKSTIGRSLSKELDLEFLDSDKMIEKKYHTSIDNIFKEEGEKKFRKYEREILECDISNKSNFILATGGGMPINNFDLLKEIGKTIYIRINPNILLNRIKIQNNKRPIYIDDNNFISLLELRELSYLKADYIIYGDNKNIKQIIEEIKGVLNYF